MVILLHLLQQVTFDPVLKRIGTLLQIIFVVVVITRYQSIFFQRRDSNSDHLPCAYLLYHLTYTKLVIGREIFFFWSNTCIYPGAFG